MRIALVQTTPHPGNWSANLAAIATAVAQAKAAGARLVLFPELTDLGYHLAATAATAQAAWPTTAARLSALATEHRLILAVGVAQPTAQGLTNALVVWDATGALRASYAKLHLFCAGNNDETAVFVPGPGPVAIEVDGLRLGLAICFDLRFPELFRAYRQAGCHGVLVAAAWPQQRRHIWQALLLARAAENAMTIVAANHSGEAPFPLAGYSMIVDPSGVTAQLQAAAGMLLGEITRPTVPAGLDPMAHRRVDLFPHPCPPVLVTVL